MRLLPLALLAYTHVHTKKLLSDDCSIPPLFCIHDICLCRISHGVNDDDLN